MNGKIIVTLRSVMLIMITLMVFKHFQGFENTICFIAALILVELWSSSNEK